jgi:catechol 2,3-dioxygenase-like lactoylglutathione lyase family enzyme
MPRVSHLLETALYVTDLSAAETFYARVLGFACILRDARMCAMELPGSGVLLLFRRGAAAQPGHTPGGTIPAHDGSGRLHLAFAVPRGELAAWESHLQAESVVIESRVEWQLGGTSLYFRDPDGHSVEIAAPGVWPNY